ncbi:MAG: PAS domain S-box protein, partial [Chloroflexi bacterium]
MGYAEMKQRLPAINITLKFIGYLIILSILPLLVVGISSYNVSRSILREEAARYTEQLVINQQDYLTLQLSQIESLIANISSVEEITNALDDQNITVDSYTSLATQARIGYILNGYSNLKGLVSIDIFSMGGAHYHVGDTLNVANIQEEVKNRIFDEALNSDKIVLWIGIEDNVNVNSTHKKVITAAKVLTRIDRTTLQQEPIALILVNYSVAYLYDHFSRVDLGEGAYLMVIDAQNRVIYHPDKTVIGSQLSSELLQALSVTTHEHRQGISSSEYAIDGQLMFINHTHSANSDWVIMSLIPISTLTEKTSTIGATTLLVLVMSFGIVLLAALSYNRGVVSPIRQITHRFQQLQDGSLDQQTKLPVRSQDEIGELVRWFNAFVDSLAAQKKVEQDLIESEKQYRGIFEAVTNGLVIINLEDIIVAANATACQMHGYTHEAFVGLHATALIHSDYLDEFIECRDSEVNDGKFYANVVTVRQDGIQLDVEMQGTAILYQGKPHQLIIIHDVTERQRTEEALRRAQKLESLGVMAGGIAHDFNNLLVAMLAQTSLALVKLPLESDAFPHIDKAVKAAEHAADLTRQMLAYSGRGQFERKAINLNALLQENLHLFEVGMPKNVQLVSKLTNPLPFIEGDQGQMQQVVMNLIINAAEAIDKRAGVVTVRTGVQELEGDNGRFWQHTGSPLPSGRYVSMEVCDNGCGMDEDTISKIFDPFFSTKFTGRGLGLAAVLGIVRGHKGGLHVNSVIGEGTTFTIFFPAFAGERAAQEPLPASAATVKSKGLVLVIDDETAVRDA